MEKEAKPTHIGGQAVIEGVMMRGKKIYTLAVRTPEKDIFTEDVRIDTITKKYPFLKIPVIRGMVAFVESMSIGVKIITKSAEIAGELEEEEELSKFDKFLNDKFGEKLNGIIMGTAVVISMMLGIGLFMLLPSFISQLFRRFLGFESFFLLSLLEGVIRITIFLCYMYLISKMKDIQRVFMYHGAEHKTIVCFEQGEELTVENVITKSRFHKRCGTSFLLFVMVVSILVFMFVRTDTLWLRLLSRVLLVPLIAGISYEVIKWAGSSSSKIVSLISYPGIKLQKFTTREPEPDMIEVAIAAMQGVIKSELEPDEESSESEDNSGEVNQESGNGSGEVKQEGGQNPDES